jgi:soluble lytic murein transglycosylase-like protein
MFCQPAAHRHPGLAPWCLALLLGAAALPVRAGEVALGLQALPTLVGIEASLALVGAVHVLQVPVPRSHPEPVGLPLDAPKPGPVPRFPPHYKALFLQVAKESRVPVALIAAVAAAESGFDPMARSRKGATGLMQLMPETARRFNVTNLLSPEDNLRGGAQYLRWLSDRFNNDLPRVIAAYNAGEGSVERSPGGLPNLPETVEYLPRVLRYLQHFDKSLATARPA